MLSQGFQTSTTHRYLNNSLNIYTGTLRRKAQALIIAVLRVKGQHSRKISGRTTANSCDTQPKLWADRTEFVSLLPTFNPLYVSERQDLKCWHK